MTEDLHHSIDMTGMYSVQAAKKSAMSSITTPAPLSPLVNLSSTLTSDPPSTARVRYWSVLFDGADQYGRKPVALTSGEPWKRRRIGSGFKGFKSSCRYRVLFYSFWIFVFRCGLGMAVRYNQKSPFL